MFRIPLLLIAAAHFCCADGLRTTHRSLLTQIHQFSNGTSVENLAIRDNGNILITLLYEAKIHEINPSLNNGTRLVHSFNNSTRVNGISELAADVFAISANHDTIWNMELRSGGDAQVFKVATISNASFLNGVTTLDSVAGTILAADSTVGAIWAINTSTGQFCIALQDETMAPPANTSSGPTLGVNGVRYSDQYVYYTNTGKQLFCRVRVDPGTGNAVGPYETIVEGFAGDDFVLVDDAAFVAGGSANVVERIFFNGTREVVFDSSDVAGATSTAFGRTDGNAGILYATTSSGGVGGGKVVGIEVI